MVNEHPLAVAILTAGSILLLVVIAVVQLLPDKPTPVRVLDRVWYYDLNTGRLFVAGTGLTPPIEAPSGPLATGAPAGVRACVLAYADDPNESERFIGFLETTAAGGSAVRPSAQPAYRNAATEWARGKLLRRVADKTWVPADSKQGQSILNEAFAPNAQGERPCYCQPE